MKTEQISGILLLSVPEIIERLDEIEKKYGSDTDTRAHVDDLGNIHISINPEYD